jgi:hypothetical protein
MCALRCGGGQRSFRYPRIAEHPWNGSNSRPISLLVGPESANQLVQKKAAHIALRCTRRESVSTMHVSLSWLKVEETLTVSLLVFMWGINVLKVTNCLFKQLAHSSDTHLYNNRHATRGLFTVPRSRTEAGKLITTWNSLPPQVNSS